MSLGICRNRFEVTVDLTMTTRVLPADAQEDANPQPSRWNSTVVSYTLLDRRLDVVVATAISDADQAASSRFLALAGGPGGLWKILTVTKNGTSIQCRSIRPIDDEDVDLASLYPYEIVHTRVDGNATLRPKSHNGVCSAILLPPLLLHCRTTIFNVYRIDTVGQTFDADVYFELRLRAIATPAVDEAWVAEVASAVGLSEKTIDCLNVVSQDGSREMWSSFSIRSMIPGYADYCFKLRLRGSFSEQLELQSFPFDTQQLHVIWTVNLPGTYVRLRANEHFPSLFLRNNFQLGNVFDVVSAEHVIALVDQSDAVESSSGHIYDHCSTSIVLQRKPGYYITNILLPMGLLTYLGFLSFAIESPNTRLATSDRLSISLTLLLTAVAYKFVVAGAIPQIPYMTTLDMHTTLSFVFLTTTAVENALFPSFCVGDGCFEAETIVMGVFAALITVGYLYISLDVHYDLRARAAEHKALIDYHLLQILIAQTYPTQPDAVRTQLLAEVCATTKTPVTTMVGDGKRTVVIKKSAGLCPELKERCLCELATRVTRLGKIET